jgi:glycosyltransferase involved in cell wall biosynthesis
LLLLPDDDWTGIIPLMKIAYLSSASIPSTSANSLQVMKMCQALAKTESVMLFAPQVTSEPSIGVMERAYGVRIRFGIRRVSPTALLGRRGLALASVRAAQAEGCQAVYTRGVDFAWWAAAAGMPTLLEVHQPPTGILGKFYFRGFLRSKLGRIVVISNPLEEKLRHDYSSLRERAILVAPDAVDLERYKHLPIMRDARIQLGLPPDTFTAGYFGSLVPGRGLALILELAARLPNVSFIICGGESADVEKRRAAHPQPNIRWSGYIPNAQVPSYQAACDVLLMPYERKVTVQGKGDTSSTMSPMKLYEYMATGRLVLASDLPALRVMLNAENCILLSPDDVAGWEVAIRSAQSDPHPGTRLAAQAKADVSRHTWENRARTILPFAFGS